MRHRLPFLLLLPLASGACERPAPYGADPVPTPVLFASGAISTDDREYGITFSPDGTEAYFTRRRGRERQQIFVSRFVEGAWTEAELAPFSSGWDESPFLTRDGQRLLFSSRRDVPGWDRVRGNNNLWVVEREGDGWSEPMPLPGDVNRPRRGGRDSPARSEGGPVLLDDGTLLYWTNEDPEWGNDLYVADQEDGAFVNPRRLLLNSVLTETNPALSPDGRFLLFQADRDGSGIEGGDGLYVSARTDYGWSQPRPLPEPINSPSNEGYPSFSPDGRYFFFASDRRARSGSWSIYYVETEALGLEMIGAR